MYVDQVAIGLPDFAMQMLESDGSWYFPHPNSDLDSYHSFVILYPSFVHQP